jgi:hypothetical protein
MFEIVILSAAALVVAIGAAVAAVHETRVDGYGRRRDPRALPGAQFWHRTP